MNARNEQRGHSAGGGARLPTIVACEATADGREYRLEVPAELVWFDGHFPGDPILPAVVQIDWAIHYGRELGFDPDQFSGFSRLKFKQVIQPMTELRLVLTAAEEKLRFTFESADGLYSQGTVLFGGEP